MFRSKSGMGNSSEMKAHLPEAGTHTHGAVCLGPQAAFCSFLTLSSSSASSLSALAPYAETCMLKWPSFIEHTRDSKNLCHTGNLQSYSRAWIILALHHA